MGKRLIVLIVIILTLCGCNTKKAATNNSAIAGQNPKALANMTKEELMAINRDLSQQVRDNFRSWSYREPEKWKYLAGKFAEEVILSNPTALPNKEKIVDAFLNHLTQRAEIMKSDSKNKQQLMSRSSAEFNYNMIFLIGMEENNKWQSQVKTEFQKYRTVRDSLTKVVYYLTNFKK